MSEETSTKIRKELSVPNNAKKLKDVKVIHEHTQIETESDHVKAILEDTLIDTERIDSDGSPNIPGSQITIGNTPGTRGMKTYEIAKELNVDNSTVSRDIKYLTAQSQNYLNNLAKETLPFMYQPRLRVSNPYLKSAGISTRESVNHNRVCLLHTAYFYYLLRTRKLCSEI